MAELNEDRKGQVTLQMKILKGNLSELEKNIAAIKPRLGSVLRDHTPDTGEKAVAEIDALVPLADDIRASANRISMLNVTVCTLLTELEL